MKKFKLFFYPIYLIAALSIIYLSFDSLMNMEQMQTWFSETFIEKNQPYWIVVVLMLLAIMMITEMIAENIQIHRLKEEIPDLEDEIVRLKAKLYDQDADDDDQDDDEDDDEGDDDDEDDDDD